MIHPDTELRSVSPTLGYGLFATRLIPAGTFTWVRDDLDQVVPANVEMSLPKMLHERLMTYSYLDRRGRVLCWDHGRFVNHSCEPNCCSTGFDLEIAVRDIRPGDELTDDYGTFNIDYEFACHCGSPRCRGMIRATDAQRLADEWDREVRAVFRRAGGVDQPLWPLLKEAADVARAIRGEMPVPSCRAHLLPELLDRV